MPIDGRVLHLTAFVKIQILTENVRRGFAIWPRGRAMLWWPALAEANGVSGVRMYQTPNTIKETLEEVGKHELVLPAIQREFVWHPNQIYRLFDSLMQGYPIGGFLFWEVAAEMSGLFNFYDFVRDYHAKDARHCPPLAPIHDRKITAVLDGQQRLTALNIGLRGSMAWKLPRLWANNPSAYPKRRLYLDVLWQSDASNEEGLKYRFQFRADDSTEDDSECWFLVRDILSMEGGTPIFEWVANRLAMSDAAHTTPAFSAIDRLQRVINKEPIIAYYREKNQELDRVLQLFIRMNDGGTPLSHSDLLLSMAVAQWQQHDAREEIHKLVDDLNRIGVGFDFSKDLVLKAGLMLCDINVGFNVHNFNRDNMGKFEARWEDVKTYLTLAVRLLADFGFSAQNLRAHYSLLPIAYYFYTTEAADRYLTHSTTKADRETVREWLVRSLLKTGVWGSGDTMLTAVRERIREHAAKNAFPAEQVYKEMSRHNRSMAFEDEEIEQLADMRYGDRITFALLSLLFTFVDLRNKFHVDHIFPASRFKKKALEDAGVAADDLDEYVEKRDGLANLQLLTGPENNEKRAQLPSEWLESAHPEESGRNEELNRHLLGELPTAMSGFPEFYDARRERLKERISELLRQVPGS